MQRQRNKDIKYETYFNGKALVTLNKQDDTTILTKEIGDHNFLYMNNVWNHYRQNKSNCKKPEEFKKSEVIAKTPARYAHNKRSFRSRCRISYIFHKRLM